jgi:uncharacterized SAM-binding protein YcdF (DUF218 family)
VPSPALRRRVAAALAAAADAGDARFLPTGAVGRHAPSEAEVMRRLLAGAGVAAERIVVEEQGTDTLSSLRHCARIVRESGGGRVVVCSDAYHLPRCRAVLRALGVRAEAAPAAGARSALGARRLAWAIAREAVATPWDVALALALRAAGPRR